MCYDIRKFISSCSSCAQAKVPWTLPIGKLLPFRTLQHPWSHIAIDFVTDLPPVQYNTVIMVIVDRFSKSLWLLPCPGSPPALRLQNFYSTTCSDTLASWRILWVTGKPNLHQVWRGFMEKLGVSAWLMDIIPKPMAKSKGQPKK